MNVDSISSCSLILSLLIRSSTPFPYNVSKCFRVFGAVCSLGWVWGSSNDLSSASLIGCRVGFRFSGVWSRHVTGLPPPFQSITSLQMAWREIRRKGIPSNLIKVLNSTNLGDGVQSVTDIVKSFPDFYVSIASRGTLNGIKLAGRQLNLTRCFHMRPMLLARRRNDEAYGPKAPKKEKFVKKEKRSQPPVEAPCVTSKTKEKSKIIA
ncbi:hypothetical protein NE237_013047 [Protea cynaroides]|uniref:Uncharacterized protein n=1 Tax=Protea cynaroides TaxID=273540 RepID=A0A9Q0GZ39_9MAGN|nr:hypothetical protein NE237_013047 [Protea cynaroides]